MPAEENKATMRRIYDVINEGNLDAAGGVIAEDVVEHATFPGQEPGLAGFKQVIAMLRGAFPDLHFTIEDMIAEGDKVVARFTMSGTHQGEFMGIAATGNRVTITGIDVARFENGKGVEHWANQDDLGMMQQLGVIPAPG